MNKSVLILILCITGSYTAVTSTYSEYPNNLWVGGPAWSTDTTAVGVSAGMTETALA